MSDDAWRRVKPLKAVDTARVRYLSGPSVRLVNACGPAFRGLVRGALLTGCRYSELAALRAGKVSVWPLMISRMLSKMFGVILAESCALAELLTTLLICPKLLSLDVAQLSSRAINLRHNPDGLAAGATETVKKILRREFGSYIFSDHLYRRRRHPGRSSVGGGSPRDT